MPRSVARGTPQRGEVIAGYEIIELVGRGASGTVFAARQRSLGRTVALKVIHPELADDDAFRARFHREAELQTSIEHPNIVTVYEAGEEQDRLFLAMRLVRGANLEALLRMGELPLERALALLHQVAEALGVVHVAELVHRDVTPRNVLVDSDDRAYLADFGLARATAGLPHTNGQILGTLHYLAPELIRGQPGSPASDIYALAGTVFTCLVGTPPFWGMDAATLLAAHTGQTPPLASSRRSGLPGEVDAVLAEGLAKDPSERPGSAPGFVNAIEAALAPAAQLPSPRGGVVLGSASRRARPSRDRLIGGIVAGAAILLAGVLIAVKGPNGGPAIPTPVAGTVAFGSRLTGEQGASLRCPAGNATSVCDVQQVDLGGAPLVIPQDGAIRAWTVRGAGGSIALELSRAVGAGDVFETLSVAQIVHGSAVHTYPVDLPVSKGDIIGVQLGPRAMIGTITGGGATTREWLVSLGRGSATAPLPVNDNSDAIPAQMALRVDYAPGPAAPPGQITGAAAARLPAGTTLAVRQDQRGQTLILVRVASGIALDLFVATQRSARLPLPAFDPDGRPLAAGPVDTLRVGGRLDGIVHWVNPGNRSVAVSVQIGGADFAAGAIEP